MIPFLQYPLWYTCFHLCSFVIFVNRSLKLILRSLKQTIGDLIPRKMIWLTSTRSTRVKWIGKKTLWLARTLCQVKDFSLITGKLPSLCRLFCSMLCSDPKLDSHRFKDILDETIAAGKNITIYILSKFIPDVWSRRGFHW